MLSPKPPQIPPRRRTNSLSRALQTLTLLLVCSASARAEPLTSLLSALDRLDNTPPIEAQLESELWRADGKGDEREEVEIEVVVVVSQDASGYHLHHGWPLMNRLSDEAEALLENPDAPIPTTDSMWRLGLNEVRPLLDAAPTLRREVQRSSFREARPDTYQGQPAQRLIFDRGEQVLDERVRKYVKKFESTLEVWIDEQGRPLASTLNLHAKGSLLFVIRGEYRETAEHHYTVVEDRLVTRRLQRWRKTDIPGEHHETRLNQTLQPL